SRQVPRESSQTLTAGRPEMNWTGGSRCANERVGDFNLLTDRARRHQYHPPVRVRMVSELVTIPQNSPREVRIAGDRVTGDKDRGAYIFLAQNGKHRVRVVQDWAVIERERYDRIRYRD